VRSELTLLFDMLEELDCAAIPPALKPIRRHLDDIFVPFVQAEAIHAELRAVVPHDALDVLVLAWHHAHLVYQSGAQPKRYHQTERDFWLACAEGLLGNAFDSRKALVFDQLDTIVRASSLVERVNARRRPSLNSGKGPITQATLNLLMFSPNQRRYQSGKRQGKAPIALLTGTPLETPWWELLRRQLHTEQGVTALDTVPVRPPLHLVTNHEGEPDQQAMASAPAILNLPGASEHNCRQKNAKAA
jgi:hypothetical protein